MRNELRMLICHHAIRKDNYVGATYADRCDIGPLIKTDALTCNELRMLMRHRAVRKDKHVGA